MCTIWMKNASQLAQQRAQNACLVSNFGSKRGVDRCFKMAQENGLLSWLACVRMDSSCRRASFLRARAAFRAPGYRMYKLENMTLSLLIQCPGGAIITWVWRGLNRCLSGPQRRKRGKAGASSLLMATPAISQWNLSISATRKRFSLPCSPLMRRIAFSHYMWCCLHLFQVPNLKNLNASFTKARAS
jgi:hypothetical protein